MFWKFNLESSGLDTLLAKQDVTLLEILDEEDVLQECKTPNEKLLDFLTTSEILKELLHLVVDTPSEDVEDTLKYKYMNVACEIIILDVDAILDKIANDQEFLDIIWSFTDNIPPLNPLIASFFSKVITMLLCRKGQQTFEYLKSHDAVNKLIVNIEISAIMELFIKMVTAVEHSDLKMEICKWLNEEKLIEKLIGYLHPSEDEQKHYCAGQLLSELVRIGRDSISQYIDSDDPQDNVESPLLVTLEKQEIIEKLLSIMFDDIDHPNSDSSVVNGICTISSMIEIKRPTIEGMEELITPMDVERIAQGCHTALEVLATRLSDFHDALVRPHPTSSMETTFGILDPPLGKVRLSIAGLIASAISTSSQIINESLSKTGTINVLLDLFSRYEWNNFLHTHVQHSIFGILNGEIHPIVDENECNEGKNTDILLKHLFQECNIVQRCLTLWEANEISEKSGNPRKGYMGHLTKVMNEIRNSREKGPNVETVQCMFNEFPDEIRQQWTGLIEGSLEETNKKNICAPMNSWFNPMDSDSEGDDYRPISISQYDGTMQQAFENYQVQPMSNEFIETFGYDENSLQENENIKNPFDEVGKIDFTINANEESENEKLYNNICEQKIRPFDDSSDSDEEDMWEEKELTFTHPSQPRESSNPIRSDSDSSSDDEKDVKADSPGSEALMVDPFTGQAKENMEKMEVDSEWTANFDCFGVSTQDSPSDWPTSSNDTAPLSTNGEDFANFTDLCKFDEPSDIVPQLDMETENCAKPNVASAYEVKMEEDCLNSSSPRSSGLSEEDSSKEKDGDGLAEIEERKSTSTPMPSSEVDISQSISSSVQSTSIRVHIDAHQNNPEKRQNIITSLDTRLTENQTQDNRKSTSPSSTQHQNTRDKTEVLIDNNERTCKNEIKIAVNKSPVGVNEKNKSDTNSIKKESVLLNGPPSSEVSVNSSGNLAT